MKNSENFLEKRLKEHTQGKVQNHGTEQAAQNAVDPQISAADPKVQIEESPERQQDKNSVRYQTGLLSKGS